MNSRLIKSTSPSAFWTKVLWFFIFSNDDMMAQLSRQSRRRFGVLLVSLVFSLLVFLSLLQDESIDSLVDEIEDEKRSLTGNEIIIKEPTVHLVVVACEGKSKSAIDEAKTMIKSAILLSTEPKIKVRFIFIRNNEFIYIDKFCYLF